MDHLRDHSLAEQSPENQFRALRSLERNDRVSVVLESKGAVAGPVTSVVTNGPGEEPEEIHVQFLDYESDFRHDDQAHHTVSVTRTDDGEWERARLSYSWTDTGRVRRETVDAVERIWPVLPELRATTALDRDEAVVVAMKEMGLTNEEIAEQWGCDEATIDAILASVRRTYERAEATVERLEASSIDLDGRKFPSFDADWQPDWSEKKPDRQTTKSNSE